MTQIQGTRERGVAGRIVVLIDSEPIPIEVTRKPIKNLYIRVDGSTCRVRVSAPIQMHDADIRTAVIRHRQWLLRRLEQAQKRQYQMPTALGAGETLRLFGVERPMTIVDTQGPARVEVNDWDAIVIHARRGSDASHLSRLLDRWLRCRMEDEVARLVGIWEPVIGVAVSGWHVRRMRTRWGSCNVRARRININLELVHRPPQCLEYVVVHELVHLLERGHNRRFYGLMDQFLIDWRTTRSLLRLDPPT